MLNVYYIGSCWDSLVDPPFIWSLASLNADSNSYSLSRSLSNDVLYLIASWSPPLLNVTWRSFSYEVLKGRPPHEGPLLRTLRLSFFLNGLLLESEIELFSVVCTLDFEWLLYSARCSVFRLKVSGTVRFLTLFFTTNAFFSTYGLALNDFYFPWLLMLAILLDYD